MILTSGPRGTGAPLIFHGADFRPVTADNPARAGELLSLYCYGFGELIPAIGTGILPPLPPPRVVGRLKVTFRPFNSNSVFDGELLWAGAAPGIIGVYQVNIRVPDTLVTDRYSISIVGAAAAATVALDVLR